MRFGLRAVVGALVALQPHGGVLAQNVGASAPPGTESATVQLNIASQSVRTALRALGEQAHLQVLLRSDGMELDRISTPAIKGSMTADEALQRMLANSGLAYEFVNARTV